MNDSPMDIVRYMRKCHLRTVYAFKYDVDIEWVFSQFPSWFCGEPKVFDYLSEQASLYLV